ncbi:G-protein coupled receptor moody-like [Neocloeon triangulifer]|uniref:G-protein coupled receptor moody-like n=1 Tax=Neocloeon triangulifer TaxID=2078957 RepID=UPI00286EDE1F|nr:G-protein coupled receptor moody-like [Neocloeon triangulifer]
MIFDFLNQSNWALSEELCAVSSLIGYGNGPTSIIMIALLSFASYVKITCSKATASSIFRPLWISIMITLGWICGYGFTALALFGIWGDIHVDSTTGYCINNGTIAGQNSEVFVAIVIFMIALLVISFTRAKFGRGGDELDYAKMIFTIFSVYVLCYLIPSILLWAKKDYRATGGLYVTYRIPPLLSTIINPLIYYKMNSKYRAAYKSLRGCKAMEEVDFDRDEGNLPI